MLSIRRSPDELRDLLEEVHRILRPQLATLKPPYGPLESSEPADGSFEVRDVNGRTLTFRIDAAIGGLALSETIASLYGSQVDRIYAVHYVSGGEATFAFRLDRGLHPKMPEFTGLVLPYFLEAVAATINPAVRRPRDFPTTHW